MEDTTEAELGMMGWKSKAGLVTVRKPLKSQTVLQGNEACGRGADGYTRACVTNLNYFYLWGPCLPMSLWAKPRWEPHQYPHCICSHLQMCASTELQKMQAPNTYVRSLPRSNRWHSALSSQPPDRTQGSSPWPTQYHIFTGWALCVTWPKCGAEVLSGVPNCKEAMMCFTGTGHVRQASCRHGLACYRPEPRLPWTVLCMMVSKRHTHKTRVCADQPEAHGDQAMDFPKGTHHKQRSSSTFSTLQMSVSQGLRMHVQLHSEDVLMGRVHVLYRSQMYAVCVESTGGKQGLQAESSPPPGFYPVAALSSCLTVSDCVNVTTLKLHSALWRQPRGWCGPWWEWIWHPSYRGMYRCSFPDTD